MSRDHEETPWQRPEAADTILRNSDAIVRTGGDRAFYSPSADFIQLPPGRAFAGAHQWASTALHELGHWTGHPTRLARDLTGRFGSGAYAQEELRAELASAFIGTTLDCQPTSPTMQATSVAGSNADKLDWFSAREEVEKSLDRLVVGYKVAEHVSDTEHTGTGSGLAELIVVIVLSDASRAPSMSGISASSSAAVSKAQ